VCACMCVCVRVCGCIMGNMYRGGLVVSSLSAVMGELKQNGELP